MKKKNVAKIFAFILIFCILFYGLNVFFQPIWKTYNNVNTIQGFYEEPENSIETVFIGASMTANGFDPIQMYEASGVCAYNLGTEQQPFFASYYWTKEAYRLQKESLKTVILDVSMLRRPYTDAFCHKALDGMKVSKIKYEAMKELEGTTFKALARLFPMYSYHSRWSSVEKNDFTKFSDEIQIYTRGYHPTFARLIDDYEADKIPVPLYQVSETDEQASFDAQELEQMYRIVDFCKEKDLQLVFMKTPSAGNWTSQEHIAVQKLADECGVEFVDYNVEPLIDEIEFNGALDCADKKHLNYYGASKFSKSIAEYLIKNCNNTDVRGKEKYAYLEQQLKDYKNSIGQMAELHSAENVADYIDCILNNENYMGFIAVKDTAASKLTQEQRDYFASVGLTGLANLQEYQSYVAVLDGGVIVNEQSSPVQWVEYSGQKKGKFGYKVSSAALPFGNVATCEIDNKGYGKNLRGINIVVYDLQRGEVVDSTCFDTFAESTRLSDDLEKELSNFIKDKVSYDTWPELVKKLYAYDQRCQERRVAE